VNGAATYDSGLYTPTAPGTYTYRIRYTGDNDNYGIGPSNCLDKPASTTITQGQMTPNASFAYPTDGGTKDTMQPFKWTAATGAQQYALWIGTSRGGYDLLGIALSASTLSYDPATLPGGRTLYARLWTMTGGSWSTYQDVSFTAAGGAEFTSPADGQTGVAPGPLTWTAAPAAQSYALWLGSTPGGYDIGGVELAPGTTSYTPTLAVGVKVYARVWTKIGGAYPRYDDVAFTPGQGATFTNPLNGQTHVDPTQPLTWSPVAGAQSYALWMGSTPGSYDLGSAQTDGSTTSHVMAGLPSGRTIYARVWTMHDGAWSRFQDVVFVTG
ncbi:MAG: hypothetical protein ACR2KV_11120, partial [Solirubrobacteraceae bacterium]